MCGKSDWFHGRLWSLVASTPALQKQCALCIVAPSCCWFSVQTCVCTIHASVCVIVCHSSGFVPAMDLLVWLVLTLQTWQLMPASCVLIPAFLSKVQGTVLYCMVMDPGEIRRVTTTVNLTAKVQCIDTHNCESVSKI